MSNQYIPPVISSNRTSHHPNVPLLLIKRLPFLILLVTKAADHDQTQISDRLYGKLILVFLPDNLALLAWNTNAIDEHTMVFDGGNHHSPPLLPPSSCYNIKYPWLCLRISRGGLYMPDTFYPSSRT